MLFLIWLSSLLLFLIWLSFLMLFLIWLSSLLLFKIWLSFLLLVLILLCALLFSSCCCSSCCRPFCCFHHHVALFSAAFLLFAVFLASLLLFLMFLSSSLLFHLLAIRFANISLDCRTYKYCHIVFYKFLSPKLTIYVSFWIQKVSLCAVRPTSKIPPKLTTISSLETKFIMGVHMNRLITSFQTMCRSYYGLFVQPRTLFSKNLFFNYIYNYIGFSYRQKCLTFLSV